MMKHVSSATRHPSCCASSAAACACADLRPLMDTVVLAVSILISLVVLLGS
ncbi:MAG TPA: hypothetical protein IAC31_09315 [Candidatus Faecousia intestinigallinarum]|nr:hypothetical protein [Candidatus Faecousia intestinigallinarum]